MSLHSASQMAPHTDKEGTRICKKIENSLEELLPPLQSLLSKSCLQEGVPLKSIMDLLERNILLKALLLAGGNQKEAAASLGMKYTTFNEKLKRHGIDIRKILV